MICEVMIAGRGRRPRGEPLPGRQQRQRVLRVEVDERLPRDVDAVRDVADMRCRLVDAHAGAPERSPAEEGGQGRGRVHPRQARLGAPERRGPPTSAATAQTMIAMIRLKRECSILFA